MSTKTHRVDLEYIKRNLEGWLEPDKTYVLNENWQSTGRTPSPYRSFEWGETNYIQWPTLQMFIELRESTQEKMLVSMVKKYDSPFANRYNVLIRLADSSIPFPIEDWEADGGPWKNYNPYMDCFYGGRLYYNDFQYSKNSVGTPSSLIESFDVLEEAQAFVEFWKKKLWDDHSFAYGQNKELLSFIQNQ